MGKLQHGWGVEKKWHPRSSVTPSNGVFLSFYGDIVRQPCPLSSPRASPSSEWDGKNGERGQSVMSKKTLKDRRAPPPGLDSTPLIDWFTPTDELREVCGGEGGKKKEKKKESKTA